jgi:hypothetical protein
MRDEQRHNPGTPTPDGVLSAIVLRGGRVVSDPAGFRCGFEKGLVWAVGYVTWDRSLWRSLNILSMRDCRSLVLFDLDAFSTQGAIEDALPGLVPVTQSPVVGKFIRGTLLWKKEGRQAMEWLAIGSAG